MKKSLCMVLSICIILSVTITANAEENEVITFEEYYNTVKGAYAQYGIEYDVISRDESVILTREMLNVKLANIAEGAATLKDSTEVDANISTDTIENVESSVRPAAYMPIQQEYRYCKTIVGYAGLLPCVADIYLIVEITANVDNGDLLSIDDYRSVQLGGATNFDSWTVEEMTVTPNFYNETFYAEAIGYFRGSYADPLTGINESYTSEETISHTFTVEVG